MDAERVGEGVKYADVRASIRDGDVLLFESRGLVSAAIRWGTRSTFSHAGLAAWWGEELMLVESVEGKGARAVRLSDAVQAAKGRIWLYRPAAWVVLDRAKVVDAARARLGRPYGWVAILLDAVGRLPLVALLLRRGLASLDDLDDAGPRVKCSTLVSLAYRAGGVDLVPSLGDRSTDPGDLARSVALAVVGPLEP